MAADDTYTVSQLRSLLAPVFADNNVSSAVLFGSYGKGTANPNSDVDILVDSGLRGLKFVGLLEQVTTALGKPVDLFDVSHVEPGSPVDLEIARTGVVIYAD